MIAIVICIDAYTIYMLWFATVSAIFVLKIEYAELQGQRQSTSALSFRTQCEENPAEDIIKHFNDGPIKVLQ